MTPIDLGLAAAGGIYATASRGGRSSRGAHLLILVLFAATALWVAVIGLTPIPMEISLQDLRAGLYASRTSWLRLEGELEPSEVTTEGYLAYVLRDSADTSLAVTVLASSPLPTGHAEVTGQPLGGVRAPGTFDAFYAEVPAEPARHDPWLFVALPAIIAALLLLGERVGYPVIRAESSPGSAMIPPLAPGEVVPARWNGRIGSEDVHAGAARTATVGVTGEDEVAMLTVTDASGVHRVSVRRATPKVSGRACRIGGCVPGLEVHATGSDIIFEFDSTQDRDRLAASLV